MKIAFIYDVIYPYVKGGAEKRNWELGRRLADKGHEVHIFGMKSWDGPRCIRDGGVYLHGACDFKKLYLDSGRRGIRGVVRFCVSIIPELLSLRFDIIDCCAFPYLPFFPVRFISFLRRTPLVVTWQEVWGDYWYRYLGRFKGGIARMIETLVIRLSPKVIAYSHKVKQDLINCGLEDERISVIPIGIDYGLAQGAPVSSETSELIFAGRLISDKNVDAAIGLTAKLKAAFPAVKCIIAGEGPEKERLLKLRGKLGLEGNVSFMGFLSYRELSGLMKSSKVFIFPSSREGFGVVVIEAMACGLPVIMLDYPMNASSGLIHEGRDGFICKDREDMAAKALELLGDENLRLRMSAAAKETARQYNWDKIAESSEAFYLGSVSKNTARS
ncbi:MAG: glycosyltransferase family 4 protein [Candidatus Omnitrophota bacterium]